MRKEPNVNMTNRIVSRISTSVEIGENNIRYLMRKNQMNPRIKLVMRTKYEEMFTGGESINADVSNRLALICDADDELFDL